METLHEHMMATKAVEYIMSAVFLTLFPFFWRLLFSRSDESESQ